MLPLILINSESVSEQSIAGDLLFIQLMSRQNSRLLMRDTDENS